MPLVPLPIQPDEHGVPHLAPPPSRTVPVLKLPLTIGVDGAFQDLAQDSPDEVAQSVALLCSTRPGYRLMVPRYGIPDMTFTGPEPAVITQAAATWEPRARVAVIVPTPPNRQPVVTVEVVAV